VLDSAHAGRQHVVVVLPPGARAGERFPAVLLFAGLGEARLRGEAGAWGWVERYGVVEALAALHRGRLTEADLHGLGGARTVAETNAALAELPFRGLVLVCPHNPVWFARGRKATVPFERFLLEELMPWAEAHLPIRQGVWGVDGVSLGGLQSTWLGFSHPDRFAAIGSLQGAVPNIEETLHRLARRHREVLATRKLQVVTSRGDGFRAGLLDFHRWLERQGLPHRFRLLPGRHDVTFLRGRGALELLLFHERSLHALGGSSGRPGAILPAKAEGGR